MTLSLDDVPTDLLSLILRSTSTPQDIARFARTCQRIARLVRQLLRDRSEHGVWRRFCSCFCGGAELSRVTDYCALYGKLRGAAAPARAGLAIDGLQFIVQVHLRTATANGGEEKELVFSEVLHGAQSTPSSRFTDPALNAPDVEEGFAWDLAVAASDRMHAEERNYQPTDVIESAFKADNNDFFAPPDVVANWAPQRRQDWMHRRCPDPLWSEVWNRPARTWVLSLRAFRSDEQKVCELMTEAKVIPNYADMGGPGGWDRQGLSFQHTPLRRVVAGDMFDIGWQENTHVHAALWPPETAGPDFGVHGQRVLHGPTGVGPRWQFHLNITSDPDGVDGEPGTAEQDAAVSALEGALWV